MTMSERRTSTLLRALAICIVVLQLSWSVETRVARGSHRNRLRMTGDVSADYNAYMKLYPNLKRDSSRFEYFKRNYQRILDHDAEKAGYSLGLTKFTGYTDVELAVMKNKQLKDHVLRSNKIQGNNIVYFNQAMQNMGQLVRTLDEDELPTNYSWTDLGKVTEVKDQGDCGSCYTFAATAAAETAYAKKANTLVDFAPQQYVSCTKKLDIVTNYSEVCNETNHCYTWSEDVFVNGTRYGNAGCDGGFSVVCWFYHNVTGIPLTLESCYPYTSGRTGRSSWCMIPKKCSMGLSICGYLRVAQNDTLALRSAIYEYGPAACAITVTDDFYAYTGGIYSGPRAVEDHEITVVGYAQTPEGQNFWIVKNSWSTTWGQDGYVWINGDNVNDISLTVDCAVPILC